MLHVFSLLIIFSVFIKLHSRGPFYVIYLKKTGNLQARRFALKQLLFAGSALKLDKMKNNRNM